MDSGIERSAYNSIEEAIEDGVAPVPLSLDRTLDVQHSIDVMDHLFSCEVLKFYHACNICNLFNCVKHHMCVLYFSGNMAQGAYSSSNCIHMSLPYENGENFIACCTK